MENFMTGENGKNRKKYVSVALEQTFIQLLKFCQIFVTGCSLCSKLGGIGPEKPYRATFETKVGKNRKRPVKR